MFKKIAVLIAADIKSIFSVTSALVFIAPALVVFILSLSLPEGLMKTGAVPPFRVAVSLGGSGGSVESMMLQALKNISVIEEIILCGKDEAMTFLDNGSVAAAVSVPAGVEDALIYRRQAVIEIWTSPAKPVEGSVMEGLARTIADSVSSAQAAVYSFNDTAWNLFKTDEDFYAESAAFARGILFEVLQRGRYVSVNGSGYGFAVQFASVAVFMTAGASALFCAVITAEQAGKGVYRRILISGGKFFHFVSAKIVLCIFVTAVMAMTFFTAAWLLGALSGFDMKLLIADLFISAAFLFPAGFMIAMLCRDTRQTAVGMFSLVLVLLLAGGGVYPLYLMGPFAVAGAYTPAAFTIGMTAWSMGGVFPSDAVICAVLMALLLPFTCVLKGGRG